MSRLYSHPVLRACVIASYLLVATVAGLFHDHGGKAGCCSEAEGCVNHSRTAGQPEDTQSSGHACGHHHCCRHHHSAKSQPAESAPIRPAKRSKADGPEWAAAGSSHGPCFVCQFLAHHHAESPTAIVSVVSMPPVGECRVSSTVFSASPRSEHPARGPPAQA